MTSPISNTSSRRGKLRFPFSGPAQRVKLSSQTRWTDRLLDSVRKAAKHPRWTIHSRSSVATPVVESEAKKLEHSPPPPAPATVTCGNCGKGGHELADCAHPSVDGYVHGCPFCNTKDHEFDCPKPEEQKADDLEKQLHYACGRRPNRPPLAIFWNWYELVQYADETAENDDDAEHIPKRFPWSEYFFFDTICRHRSYAWQEFDYQVNDPLRMPVDMSTRHMRALKENYPLLRTTLGPIDNSPLVETYYPEGWVRGLYHSEDHLDEPNSSGNGIPWPPIPDPLLDLHDWGIPGLI